MNWLRRWLHPEMVPPGFRGTHCLPEAGLPEGYVPPSAALAAASGRDGYHPADVTVIRGAP